MYKLLVNGTKSPGPGKYKPLALLDNKKGTIVSTFKNPSSLRFASTPYINSRRDLQYRSNQQTNPGPGEYLPTSEFGIYLSKHCPQEEFDRFKQDKTFIKKTFK